MPAGKPVTGFAVFHPESPGNVDFGMANDMRGFEEPSCPIFESTEP